MPWVSPSIRVQWGPYFKTDPEEQLKVIQMVQAALGSGGNGERLITTRVGVEKIASLFDVENIDALMDALEEENEERAEKAMEQTTSEAEALHKIANADAKAKPAPGGRSSKGKEAPAAGSSGRPEHDPEGSISVIEQGLQLLSGHDIRVSMGSGTDKPM